MGWAAVSLLACSTIKMPLTAPTSEGSPYMPVITYTMACPTVISRPSTCSAVFLYRRAEHRVHERM